MAAALPQEYAPLAAAVRGRYELVRELGRGGMGLVVLAHDLSLDRFVAIKTLPVAMAAIPAWRERFLREARAAAQLSHPHIVPIHAVEEHPEDVFFVMAYVPGETLGGRLRRTGPLAPREGIRILREIAWALAHAHARGIVHRDIKPDNVLLDAESGRALVVDFGLAARDGIDAPAGGTVRFMSPEQAAGDGGGQASDIYAWGATAWVLSTGRAPFDGPTAAAIVAAQAAGPAPSFADVAVGWPPAVGGVVDRALLGSPADRWPSADALAAALGGVLPAVRVAPAPVRAFLREVDRVGSELATLGTVTVVSAVVGVALTFATSGFDSVLIGGLSLFTAVVAGFATLARGGALAFEARRMCRRGFGHDALQQAWAVDAAEPDDERRLAQDAAHHDRGPLIWQAVLATLAALLAYLVATDAFDNHLPSGDYEEIVAAAASIVLPTFVVRAIWRLCVPRGGLVGRLLRGRLGAAFFRVAGFGLPRDMRPAAPDAALSELMALGPASDGLRVTDLLQRAQAHADAARALARHRTPLSEPSG